MNRSLGGETVSMLPYRHRAFVGVMRVWIGMCAAASVKSTARSNAIRIAKGSLV